MRAPLVLLALGLIAAAPGPDPAAPDPAVYRCTIYLTGTDQRERPAAFQRCVQQVLTKLGADPALADAPLLPAGQAAAMIDSFAYLDRMSDQPTHDEQGTRDRPYLLIGTVRPDAAAAALAAMGHAAWVTPRPALPIEATARRGPTQFRVTADGDAGERQRQAALAAGERFALPVTLPPQDTPPRPGALPGVLIGAMVWSDPDAGWNADWQFDGQSWTIRGVSFDEAFRAGVGGAARILSGR